MVSLGALSKGLFSLHSKNGRAYHDARLAIKLRDIIRESEDLMKLISQDELAGDIEKVMKDWVKELNTDEFEEKMLEELTKDQLLEFMEIEKDIEYDEKLLEDALKKLQEKDPEHVVMLQAIIKEFKRIQAEFAQSVTRVTKEERDMMRDRERWVKYWTLETVGGESGQMRLAKAIQRLGSDEYYAIENETKLQKGFAKKMDNLIDALADNKIEEAKKIIDRIDVKTMHVAIKKEIAIIEQLQHDVNIILIHLISTIKRKIPALFAKLATQGFPKKSVGKLNSRDAKIFNAMHTRLWRIYKSAKFERKIVRQAA